MANDVYTPSDSNPLKGYFSHLIMSGSQREINETVEAYENGKVPYDVAEEKIKGLKFFDDKFD